MIRRSRRSVRRPAVLGTPARRALDELRDFARIGRRERSQLRFPFEAEVLADSSVGAALSELFEQKCAYCESALAGGELHVDRFRPEQEAMDLEGTVDDPDLYWWLAYEWANLYPACSGCARAKSTRFPVRGERAAPEARGPELEREHRLVLDPCQDEPEAELRFAPDGSVAGATERGAVTIECVALNRRDLREARRAVAVELLAALAALDPTEVRRRRHALAPSGAPYTALRRQLIAEHLGEALPPRRTVEPHARGSVWLDRIDIVNFKGIRRLALEFPVHRHEAERQPWLMLLGVNGVGKSSVLQAIALTFMRDRDRRRYVPDASQLVNRLQPEPEGRVELTFSDGARVRLGFRRDSAGCTVEGRPPQLNVYAYGSTRLPPAPGDRSDDRPRLVRLDNLFDPRYPLSRAEDWMASVDHVPSRRFGFLASALRTLLELDEDDRLVRTHGTLRIRQDGLTLPMADYSDGYRSIVAFTTDLMLNLSDRWDSISTAEGLVLVDELEVHLHPTWRMTAVARLREVFPRLRFVVTTHDPLCLRGSESGEVHVLVRDDDTREVEARQRDIPPGLTADELLTGAWFGMATTLDRGTTALMQEHGRLLLGKPTPAGRRRRREIEAELRRRRGTFAETSDERLVRSVVAELRGEQELTGTQRAAAKQAVLQRVRARREPPE